MTAARLPRPAILVAGLFCPYPAVLPIAALLRSKEFARCCRRFPTSSAETRLGVMACETNDCDIISATFVLAWEASVKALLEEISGELCT